MVGIKGNSISKILMTADTLGGVWTYAMVLSEELGLYGMQVHLATMGRKLSPQQWETASKIPNLHIYESEYKLEWMQDPWEDIAKANQWLQELAREIEPDIVHLNGYCHGSLDWRVPAVVVAHSDVYSWHYHVKGSAPGKEWKRYHEEVEKGLNGADQMVVITEAVKDDLDRHFSFSTEQWIIRNGLPPKNFRSGEKEPMVLGLGRVWDEAKNFRLLNEASRAISVPVAVAGERKHPESGNYDEFEHLWLTGSLDSAEVANLLGQAAVYCLPAKYEPFGYTPLEAAFSGCALLLSDIQSLRELWQDAAVFFDPKDPEDLKSKLERLFADENLRQAMAEKAWSRAQDFTAARMAASYMELYRFLLNQKETEKQLAVYEN